MHKHFDRSATGSTDCRVDWKLSYKSFVISVIFMADKIFCVQTEGCLFPLCIAFPCLFKYGLKDCLNV